MRAGIAVTSGLFFGRLDGSLNEWCDQGAESIVTASGRVGKRKRTSSLRAEHLKQTLGTRFATAAINNQLLCRGKLTSVPFLSHSQDLLLAVEQGAGLH
jgi:hypothetical protein